MTVRYYPAIIEKAGGNFSVFFPDVPGCVSVGDTVEETAANAEAALALHFQGMQEDKDPIPEPSAWEAVAADPEVEEYARVLVRATLPGKAMRVNITMDEGLLEAADDAASRMGLSRSGFLAEAVRTVLRAEANAGRAG